MAGFFNFSKPPLNHAEKVLRDELAVLAAAENVVQDRSEKHARELRVCDRELKTIRDREVAILHALNGVLTQQPGTA